MIKYFVKKVSEATILRRQGLKRCAACGKVKERELGFYTYKGTASKLCRECHRVQENSKSKKLTPKKRREYLLWSLYRLRPEDFDAKLESQGGGCVICGTFDPGSWSVDHNHSCCAGTRSCGQCIRGILCGACNRGLGQFKDDPVALESAAKYLRNFQVPIID